MSTQTMEDEPKPTITTPISTSAPIPDPNTPITTMPPPQAPPPTTTAVDSLHPQTKKRPLDFKIENSNYFKMRSVLKDLRPHFIEVLRTPDFRNCTAAHEIREQTKLLLDAYKQMIGETEEKDENMTEGHTISDDQNVKLGEHLVTNQVFENQSEEKLSALLGDYEDQEAEDVKKDGSYIVGGSAFGWNFVTFPAKKIAFYGVTKEAFRSQAKSSLDSLWV